MKRINVVMLVPASGNGFPRGLNGAGCPILEEQEI